MSWLNLPEEIRAALTKPPGVSSNSPNTTDTNDLEDDEGQNVAAAPKFTNAISYEDWKRDREWTILAPPW
ncbi:hypothetical protein ACIRRA_18760 [Nocardia sp. NPDC101769]|uniref:hypothetical protein n=1 Tax=Nocardia sp. NPDC101769 TaxID=3364333 RepID=UPI003805E0BB